MRTDFIRCVKIIFAFCAFFCKYLRQNSECPPHASQKNILELLFVYSKSLYCRDIAIIQAATVLYLQ
jgi:hypothetical protein